MWKRRNNMQGRRKRIRIEENMNRRRNLQKRRRRK
jgi:hypothetical protein